MIGNQYHGFRTDFFILNSRNEDRIYEVGIYKSNLLYHSLKFHHLTYLF